MSEVEVRGGASSSEWRARAKHNRRDAEHVAGCTTCQRVTSTLRALGRTDDERGTWSESLGETSGTSIEEFPRGPRWGR
jgi:hypothetical protein